MKTALHTEADRDYDGMVARIQSRVGLLEGPFFRTDTADLFDRYLASVPNRLYHTCHTCRRFFELYGGAVTIDEEGLTSSVFWRPEEASPYYALAFSVLQDYVTRAKVTGAFYSADKVWGHRVTGEWTHYAVVPNRVVLFDSRVKTPFQAEAAKHEDFKNVVRALSQYTLPTLETAVELLRADVLYRSEKVLGAAEWLRDLASMRAATKNAVRRNNLTWRSVVRAPAGFCHPRSSMIGTLLDDIQEGKPLDRIRKAFADKMSPLQYLRPTAAPSAGNIAQAEKLFEQLGLAPALERRFARLDEVRAFWQPPKKPEEKREGVFGHLLLKPSTGMGTMQLPRVTMTWAKFQKEVLPEARRIQLHTGGESSFFAFVTAVYPEAPPILQWDLETDRNPVSHYVWIGGSRPEQWSLPANSWVDVPAISQTPAHWTTKSPHRAERIHFLLEGARETRFSGLAIFPEDIRSELHEVRGTIEAFSKAGTLVGAAEGSACGLMAGPDNWHTLLRVETKLGLREYLIDRWD